MAQSTVSGAVQHRDPNDPIQRIHTKKHGQILVNGRFWVGGPEAGRGVIFTPQGTFQRLRGGAIRSKQELDVIPPGEWRDRAYEWWENKDKWQEQAPRKIIFQERTGYPIYEDTGEFVQTESELQAFWPTTGPTEHILWGAVRALYHRLEAEKAAGINKPVVAAPQSVPPEPPKALPATHPDSPAFKEQAAKNKLQTERAKSAARARAARDAKRKEKAAVAQVLTEGTVEEQPNA